MALPPYATLRASINGGSATTGGITATLGATVQLSADPAGLSGATSIRYEIYGYPSSFSSPAGWSVAASGAFYYVGATPPTFTVTPWGKYLTRLILNGGISNVASIPSTQLTHEETAISVSSPSGLLDLAPSESTQFSERGWARDSSDNLRVLEAGLTGVVSLVVDAVKDPVVTITTTNVSLSGLGTHNGHALTAGQRILVLKQTDPIDNGIFLGAVGAWPRADDMPAAATLKAGLTVTITGGDDANSTAQLDGISDLVVDSDALEWTVKGFLETEVADALRLLHVSTGGRLALSNVRLANSAPTAGQILVAVNLGGGVIGYEPTDFSGASGTIPAADGGTGIAGAGGVANRVLITTDGTSWSAGLVSLTAMVSGTLPVANGGTALTAVGAANTVLTSTGAVNLYAQVANPHVAAAAAIDGSKIAPNFVAQTIKTTGATELGSGTVSTAGLIRVPAAQTIISSRLNGGSGNYAIIGTDVSDNLQFGSSSNATTIIDSATSAGVHLRSGGTTRVAVSNAGVQMQQAALFWSSTSAGFVISQTNANSPSNCTLRAQGCTTSSAGGALQLQGGRTTGGLMGAVRMQLNPDDATPQTIVGISEVASGRRVLSLLRAADLTTTQMPTNSGDLVMYHANAATVPTAGPVSGFATYSYAGSRYVRSEGDFIS